jgi:hypothetical protein
MTEPDDVSGLIFWLKADQITGLIDNDPISTWEDQSGNGFDVTQAGADRPTYKTGIINSLPVVRFDGVTEFMSRAPDSVLEPSTLSIFAIYSTSSGINGRVLQYSAGADSNNFGRGYGFRASSTVHSLALGNGTTDTSYNGTRTGLDPTYGDVHYDGSEVTVYERGTLLSTTTPAIQGISYTNVTAYSIGKLEAPLNQDHFNGDLAEIFVYDGVVSQADREALQDYLKQKWLPFTVTRPLAMDVDDEDGSRFYQTAWASGDLVLEQYTTSGLTLVTFSSFGTVSLANINNRSEFIFPYVAPLFGTANFGDRVFACGRWTSGGTSHLALSTDGGATFGANLGDGTWGAGWVGAFFADDINTYYAFVNGGSRALWRSLDGGSSWSNLSSLPFDVDHGGVSKHPDGRILISNRDAGAATAAYAEAPDYASWIDATGSPSFPAASGAGSRSIIWIT